MNKDEILRWSKIYEEELSEYNAIEKKLGDKFRETKVITKANLIEIVKWKFYFSVGRTNLMLGYVKKNSDKEIEDCSRVFDLTPNEDSRRVGILDRLKGVGPAVASSILSFYDPENYGVFDTRVWREVYGEVPKGLFSTSKDYPKFTKLLTELRNIAKMYSLKVRTVEKAYWMKNKRGKCANKTM